MESARNGAAQKTLRTALAAAGAVYGDVLIDGRSNYAGTKTQSKKIYGGSGTPTAPSAAFPDTTYTDDSASELAAVKLREKEPGLVFKDKAGFGILESTAPDASTVWVSVNSEDIKAASVGALTGTNPNGHQGDATNPDNTIIRAGELIRLGIISASGASFCVISVASSSDTRVTGEGYQSVSDTDTQRGAGADCGAETAATPAAHDTAGTGATPWAQMPNTPGTDRTLSAKPSSLNTAPGTAQIYSS